MKGVVNSSLKLFFIQILTFYSRRFRPYVQLFVMFIQTFLNASEPLVPNLVTILFRINSFCFWISSVNNKKNMFTQISFPALNRQL